MDEHTKLSGPVKAPQDLLAGVFLIALALFAWWMTSNLSMGTLRSMGPGMVPRGVAMLIALTGVVLVLNSFIWEGPPIPGVSIRGPLFITLGIIAFGLTVRGFRVHVPFTEVYVPTPALGMLGAGPLAILIGGLASDETRYPELIVFAAAMTTFCWLLFKVALNLPIPLMPLLLGY